MTKLCFLHAPMKKQTPELYCKCCTQFAKALEICVSELLIWMLWSLRWRQWRNWILLPLLFAIYLHDLEQFLRDKYNGLNLLSEIQNQNNLPNEMENYIKLFVLMCADDTILLAESEEDLQDALSAMFNYCNKWKLQLYVKKTKIVVFSRGKIRKIPNVFFGPKLLDVVDNDTYLGVKFNFNGRFVNEKQLRYSNGCRAMVSLLRKARTLALPIYIHLQLFQTLVTPVVMHLKFCKYILFLSKCTYTNMVYGETGEIPLSLRVKCRIIKYWRKIITCQARKLSSYIYYI